MKLASEKYVGEEFSLCRAAEFAGVSIQQMARYLAERGISFFGTVQFSSDGMKYYFQNLLNRRRTTILNNHGYVFVSSKSLILRFLVICNKNENIGR